jgi:hypothetical protein
MNAKEARNTADQVQRDREAGELDLMLEAIKTESYNGRYSVFFFHAAVDRHVDKMVNLGFKVSHILSDGSKEISW